MKIVISESQLRKLVSEQVKSKYKESFGDDLKKCEQKFTLDMLTKAKDHWKKWLNNPETIIKIAKSLNTTESNIKSSLLPEWLKELDLVQIKYVNLGNSNLVAFVDPSEKDLHYIYVNCDYETEGVNIVSNMVHELQHRLDMIHPINPELMVAKISQSNYRPKINPFGKLFKDSEVLRLCKMFGVDDIERMRKVMIYWHSTFGKKISHPLGYQCNPEEVQARVSEIRYQFDVQPGQPLPIQVFKDVFMGKLQGTEYMSISWLLNCWGMNWFDGEITDYVGHLDSLAKNNNMNVNTNV
jgi:hypothetical protein